ncbi:sensor histidine kinase [Terricaulis silvestris]|uniref:histidine kinase n=1 Tax=Terricaulis silvestris TaxID=2686094 RepID=A0A6I6MTH2_9CAUL|nr:HAMP domain-containing sensor histidine kinase [Terricaulis silvestris]QGZ94443.1 Globin-coupled histidine kinase [Terricaulis silvestris]
MANPDISPSRPGPIQSIRNFVDSLAGRLLGLTVIAVLVGEALVFAGALAGFHEQWLRERMNLAQIAALALEVSPDLEIAESLEYELLTNAEVQRAALQRAGERVLLLEDPNVVPTEPLVTYDYTQADEARPFWWAVESFFAPPGRVLRVLSRPRFESGEFIEIVLNEAPLKRAMNEFAQQFLLASTWILIAAAALIYFMLTLAFVGPMHDLTRAIERFRDKPEDVSIAFPRSSRGDEIGRAQRAAADMAEQVRNALRQNERLAALGGAVARIGHDLRNMLSTAQLVADRLKNSEDEEVRRLLPRLERTIDRAAGLASSTLKYGRADEKAPELERVDVAVATEDAASDALGGFEGVSYRGDIEPRLACVADAEHLNRIVVNLMRNAAQAMVDHDRSDKTIVVRAVRVEGRCEIDVIDHGPGVRENLRARLFEPFVSAAPEAGGTGLGLAIARELTRSMGGELELTRTGAEGTTFRITLPAA